MKEVSKQCAGRTMEATPYETEQVELDSDAEGVNFYVRKQRSSWGPWGSFANSTHSTIKQSFEPKLLVNR